MSAPSSLQARSIDTTLVSSILHLSPIEHSKHLSLHLDLRCSNYSTRLPIATIKNWLFRSLPVGENSGVGSLFMHISLLGRIENITDFVDAIQSVCEFGLTMQCIKHWIGCCLLFVLLLFEWLI